MSGMLVYTGPPSSQQKQTRHSRQRFIRISFQKIRLFLTLFSVFDILKKNSPFVCYSTVNSSLDIFMLFIHVYCLLLFMYIPHLSLHRSSKRSTKPEFCPKRCFFLTVFSVSLSFFNPYRMKWNVTSLKISIEGAGEWYNHEWRRSFAGCFSWELEYSVKTDMWDIQ